MAQSSHSACRVCGFYAPEYPWGKDKNTPSYEICSCCGVEFGNEDYTLASTKEYREKWLRAGAKWFDSKIKPLDWDLEKQMQHIPEKYRK